jgi:ectoine hydroxylase-related dioxygenase (phytanoyl-CoA dioxygenase family)
MNTPAQQDVGVLMVSDEQVADYDRDGWVKVPSLITAGDAARLLEAAQALEEPARADAVVPRDLPMWREWRFVARDGIEPFASLAVAAGLGENISRLGGRGAGVRYWNDIVARKSPSSTSGGSGQTVWHQDFPNHPIDRLGGATVWIALDDVSADQGAMSFVSGSHREGPLGRTYSSGTSTGGKDHLAQYPWLLDRYRRSAPVELQAGDATFHHPLTVHGAGANTTHRPRWSFIVMYAPADAVYTGASYPATDDLGLAVGEPFDHPSFPIVWQGSATG